tara:strand:- start:104 stop:244 length:141 start_codon:yes stop_codon:yes gene_type:complete
LPAAGGSGDDNGGGGGDDDGFDGDPQDSCLGGFYLVYLYERVWRSR